MPGQTEKEASVMRESMPGHTEREYYIFHKWLTVSSLVLSYILPYPFLSYPILHPVSYPILACPTSYVLFLSYLILSYILYLILSYPFLSYPILHPISYPILAYPTSYVLSYPNLSLTRESMPGHTEQEAIIMRESMPHHTERE